ncbi:hypothetical protein CPB83DRAFT_862804 [Crepidotus variabilis]|uniref:Uncharacterized protein n=1 Tax=Crepidotus variabilis TaxID=179855 RepID=A0A9P6JJQ2_9AGAR|nr:hypothetical protein CPB83DRAFT_862804 [Crepidotus variabilis]
MSGLSLTDISNSPFKRDTVPFSDDPASSNSPNSPNAPNAPNYQDFEFTKSYPKPGPDIGAIVGPIIGVMLLVIILGWACRLKISRGVRSSASPGSKVPGKFVSWKLGVGYCKL